MSGESDLQTLVSSMAPDLRPDPYVFTTAVGLTAFVATRLAEAGMSCNVVAGYHHDHLFVPFPRGPEAVALLTSRAP